MNIVKLLIMLTLGLHYCAFAQWTGTPFATLFCPGILSSELQVTKYCPEYGIRKLYSSDLNDFAFKIKTSHYNIVFSGTRAWAVNFAEMIPADKRDYKYSEILTLNGLISTCAQHFAKKANTLFGPYQIDIDKSEIPKRVYCRRVQPNDATSLTCRIQHIVNAYCNFYLNWSSLNFGQETDVKRLKNKHRDISESLRFFESIDVIGFGFSRGSAALFNYTALWYEQGLHNKSLLPFKALVFEACPMNIAGFMSRLNVAFLEKTTTFKKDGICPEALTSQFAEVCKRYDIPLLFVCSKKDEVVPYEQTLRMCLALKAHGVNNIHLIVLKEAGHNAYLFDNDADRTTYHRAIHRFYKKCGLSYVASWADQEDKGELIQLS